MTGATVCSPVRRQNSTEKSLIQPASKSLILQLQFGMRGPVMHVDNRSFLRKNDVEGPANLWPFSNLIKVSE